MEIRVKSVDVRKGDKLFHGLSTVVVVSVHVEDATYVHIHYRHESTNYCKLYLPDSMVDVLRSPSMIV